MYIDKLKQMFREVTIAKDASKIKNFYHSEFLLYTNGKTMNYQEFLESHEKIYATPIQYEVRYEKETFIESGNKVAGRMWVTTQQPNEPKKEIEIILIAYYQYSKIYRLWELTYPDWSQMSDFEAIEKKH